jgi:hypothetical protein
MTFQCRFRFVSLVIFLLTYNAFCQSPGPDWPNCAAVSRTIYEGWEFYRLSHEPYMENRPDAVDNTLYIDAQNTADGSRTICFLSANASSTTGITLDSRLGGCETGWDKKYETFTNNTRRAPTAVVTFDVTNRVLAINQTWTCREQGQL